MGLWTQIVVVKYDHFFLMAPYYFISTLKQYKEKKASDAEPHK